MNVTAHRQDIGFLDLQSIGPFALFVQILDMSFFSEFEIERFVHIGRRRNLQIYL